MTKIKKAENQPNFPKLEETINSFWKENKIFEKSVEQRPVENQYRFLDGPPFPSGMPHYGHLCWSVGKDIVPRYQTMRGKRVRRVWGWDCHGIAVESKVNKELGISSRKEIEEYGIENYVKKCREYVERQIANWGWYIEKIGRWVDMDNAYYTMLPEYHESVMWAFKQIWDKGKVYKGKRVSLFSTETGTPVSDFEVAEGNDYRDIEDLSVFPKFKLKGNLNLSQNNTSGKEHNFNADNPIYLLAWTTTPWTLPSNFALAVNPEADYCFVSFENTNYIVAKERLEYSFKTSKESIGIENDKLVQILGEEKGSFLAGFEYEPLYDYFTSKSNENDFKVYLYEGVTTEDGTGVLHVAPAFGEEDFNLGKKFGLSDFADIDEEGKMTLDPWKGIYLRDASPLITEDLTNSGKLFRSEMHTHRLPFYRGSEPLIYMAQDQYFIDIQNIKDRMLELNENINWIPGNVKTGRFPAVVKSAPDWAVSRNRYWATIMPVWRAEDGEEMVVGTFEEMSQYTDQLEMKEENGRKVYYLKSTGEKLSAHRDKCDQIILRKDGKEFKRIPEVLDVWLDSGCASFAEFHYPIENKDYFGGEDFRPADFIIEGAGMVRAWFNVLHRVSTLVFDQNSFSNVICGGTFSGNDGRKMSKTYGNYSDPKDVLENLGGETLRLYLAGSAVMGGGEADWSDEILKEMQKNILIPLWNTYKYFTIYADLHNFSPENAEFVSDDVLDKWLESYVKKQVLAYAKALDAYDIPESVKLIQPTIDNISAWWIRRSRDRFANGDTNALQTLYAALVTVTKAFSPQMPFVTEEIYQNLVRDVLANAKESVHLEDFPEFKLDEIDEKLLSEMEVVREVCTLGQAIRVQNGLKVRQPLQKAFISSKSGEFNLAENLIEIIKDELNVKEVEITNSYPKNLVFRIVASSQKLGLEVALDERITPELKAEGLYAELKRQVQNLRKTSGLQMGELASLQLRINNEELIEVVKNSTEDLKKDCSLSSVELVEEVEGSELKVDSEVVIASLKKI